MPQHIPTPLLLVIIGLVVLAIISALVKAKFSGSPKLVDDGQAYELRGALFSPAERSFLGVLEHSLPDGIGLLAKVRLGDIFAPRSQLTSSLRLRALNKINQKHVDFLLVRTSDLALVAGIELDDSSHARADRKQRDAFVDEVFRTCNLPLLHVPVQARYSQTFVRDQIATFLASNDRAA